MRRERTLDNSKIQEHTSSIYMHKLMDPYSSEREMDYVRRRNATRPSVIYFHGFLNRERVVEKTEDRGILTENVGEVKRCFNMQEEDYASKDERKTIKDTTIYRQDVECLETEEDCLRKRHRTSFTSSQLQRLEEEFNRDCYIVGMKRWRLSEELDIPEKQIKIWFQNKRTKMKKH